MNSSANPFDKTQFPFHRPWEESLVEFLTKEAQNPDLYHWQILSNGKDTRRSAAFSALLLSNLLETKPGFRQSAEKTYAIYRALNDTEGGGGAQQFEQWLRSGWLNVSRVASRIDMELKCITRESG